MNDLVKLVKDAAALAERSKQFDFLSLLQSAAAVTPQLKDLLDFARQARLDPAKFILGLANADEEDLSAAVVIGQGVSSTAYNGTFAEHMVRNGHGSVNETADRQQLKDYVTQQKVGWTGTIHDVYTACGITYRKHSRELSYWMHSSSDAPCLLWDRADGLNVYIRAPVKAWN